MKDEFIVGLDIGTTKICLAVGKKDEHDKLKIVAFAETRSIGVAVGMVQNIQKATEQISQVVNQASENSKIEIKKANVGIAGKHIKSFTRHNSIYINNKHDNEINSDHLMKLLYEAKNTIIPPGDEIIAVTAQNYLVDEEINTMEPIGTPGKKLEADFHIVTARKTDIKNIISCVEKASIFRELLVLEPQASSLAILTEGELESGVCLVDIGGGTTDVAIFHENVMRHTAIIPYGGEIITQDIKDGLQVLTKQAEILKIKFGRAIASHASKNEHVKIPGIGQREERLVSTYNLCKIIEARMEEIIQDIHKEIILSGYNGKLSGGIVLTGGGSQLLSLKQLVKYMTGMIPRIGFPDSQLSTSEFNLKSPKYSTLVGLLISGYKKNRISKNNKRNLSSNSRDVIKEFSDKFKSFFTDSDLDEFKK